MSKIYVATYSMDIVALLFLCGLLHSSNMLNTYRKKPFRGGIVLIIIIIFAEAGTLLTGNADLDLHLRSLNFFCNILGFSLTPIIPIALITIFDIKILQTHKLLLLPTLINIVAVALSPFWGLIFYIDINNQYSRGNYFIIFVATYLINISFLAISTLHVSKKYHYPIKGKVTVLSLFTMAGTSIQLVDSSVYASWHCVTLSLFLYFHLLSEFDSSFDPLTGLYNRAAFENAAKQMDSRKAFAIIVIDIDNFKNINDTYGHDCGDRVLKAIAAIIRESLNNDYICYRVGGDEFYIISNETNQENIQYKFEQLSNFIAEKRRADGLLPSISYGYSIFHGGETFNFNKILKEADNQMYIQKNLSLHENPV